MTAAIIAKTRSVIAPATERVYHQSNLIGDWRGLWQKSRQIVDFKVLNIRGDKAQIEYSHNGHTERGLADVDGATLTYGNVTIATRDGQTGILEFKSGSAEQTAVIAKVPDSPADQSKLVGSWSGYSPDSGKSASFTVISVDGREAQVRFSANGSAVQTGSASVYKNTVMFGTKAQFTSDDGQTGKVVVQVNGKSFAVPVTRLKTASSSSSGSQVDKLA